jgi:hypothetical protein
MDDSELPALRAMSSRPGSARSAAYAAFAMICFEGIQRMRDIAARAAEDST